MTYVALLARLLYDTPGAVMRLRATRPVVPALLAGAVATALYAFIVNGLFHDLIAIAHVGGFDEGGAMILVGHLRWLPVRLLPVVFISLLYVPTSLLLVGALNGRGEALDTLRRDYSATISVALSAWCVTLVVWALPALLLVNPNIGVSRGVWMALPAVSFLIPMSVNLAQVDGAGYGRGILASLIGGFSLALLPIAAGLTFLLSSPIVLVVVFLILRAVTRDWSSARQNRERLRRNLELSTLNPADAGAHVDLGLIYQEQGDVDRAAHHFQRALEIDPYETDALYQLGRISRLRGQLGEAISRFDLVVQVDDDYSHSEVWREIGATYYTAGMYDEARTALDRFLERRPSDAEGLYMKGLTLAALGRQREAEEQMEAVIAAVRTAPTYKYRLERRWLREAEAFLKHQ